jgi:SAM-dependent methyltransferase
MTVEKFFELFLIELKDNPQLWRYYKFHTDDSVSNFEFRKAYFCQRLQYILDHIDRKDARIWDCGCGYGTTALFLAMNGIAVYGSTLEFYYKEIPARLKYWSQYGDSSLFTSSYTNVFDENAVDGSYDIIIVQDTLHHLEPIDEALKIFNKALASNGKIISVEENGSNLIQRLKLFKQRGYKLVIEYHDEKLNKTILLGNENIRGLNKWKNILADASFRVDDVNYVRFFLPHKFNGSNTSELIAREQKIWKNNSFLREYFFFGLNYVAYKTN